MAALQKHLEYFVQLKLDTDLAWRPLEVKPINIFTAKCQIDARDVMPDRKSVV